MENRGRNIKKSLGSQLSLLVSSVKINEPLKNHTTFRVGGPASFFVELSNSKEVQEVFTFSNKEKIPFLVMGGGSNILFGDHGFKGIVAKLSGDFKKRLFKNETVEAGCAINSSALLNNCIEKELSGVECLAGIPGTLGGAIWGNAGTGEDYIGDYVKEVEIVDNTGKIKRIDRKILRFSYRGSNLKNCIILKAILSLKKAQKNVIVKKTDSVLSRRLKTQPIDKRCAGCVFKNPENDNAGRLIELAGLKGLSFGQAKVSEKHANFIVNEGEAKALDIRSLITVVRNKVKEKFSIELDLEINVIGD
ncbi:UDP-N-acetylmuramate dehydrogenase [Elusimicrobiota bacterium]